MVLDEAQAIKNPGSRQARAAKRLTAGARVALTGTPVENRLAGSLVALRLPQPRAPRPGEALPRVRAGGHDYGPLRALVRPYILRRLKTDRRIIADLPDKTEVTACCADEGQAALYRKAVDDFADDLERPDGHAAPGPGAGVADAPQADLQPPRPAAGATGGWDPADSGKFARLRRDRRGDRRAPGKALVFTQFREIAEPLASFLAGIFGRPGLVLHGGTAVRDRADRVAAFQREDGPRSSCCP